jgi:DNA-binding MarR family transcriptional regulator
MTVGSIPTQSRPIGFWLKLLDRLIEQTLDAALAAERLTRRDWQVLNVVQQGVASSAELEERLQPFLDHTEPTTDLSLRQLRERGWSTPLGDPLALTTEGQAAIARLQGSVSAARRALMRDVDPAEYQATVAVLERMARSLGWREPSP